MGQNNVIMIDEESFKNKAFEVMKSMIDKGDLHLSFAATIAFAELHCKLFHPQEALKETEQE